MNNFYNQNNFNVNNFLQCLVLADAERDNANNLVYKRSSLKTLLTPGFFLLALVIISAYFLFEEGFKLVNLIIIITPVILFIFFFLNAAKTTYIVKVSQTGISKKFLLKRNAVIDYTNIESVQILIPLKFVHNLQASNILGESAAIIGMSLKITSQNKTIVMPVTIKGFVDFYKIFKESFPGGEAQEVLKQIALSYHQTGIDLEQRKVIEKPGSYMSNSSPFEGF